MKRINSLAAAILTASSANAAFDEGNAVLYAYDPVDEETYFVDLGITGQDLVDGSSLKIKEAGLGAFLDSNQAAQWTIIASVNDTTLVAAPPAGPDQPDRSLANSGVVSTSGINVGFSGSLSEVQRGMVNDWLALVQIASAGSSAFGLDGANSFIDDPSRYLGFFNLSFIAVGSDSDIFYSQANPDYAATLADASVVSKIGVATLSYGGFIEVNPVFVLLPVPATAWLFSSALFGLVAVNRRTKRILN